MYIGKEIELCMLFVYFKMGCICSKLFKNYRIRLKLTPNILLETFDV